MSALLTKLQKLERAAGLAGPCRACKVSKRYDDQLTALCDSWGLPRLSLARLIRERCPWCGQWVQYPAEGFTPEEVAAYEGRDALYWWGQVCAPEYDRLSKITTAAGERILSTRFGEHADEVRALLDERASAFDDVKEVRAPCAYLCRVPGCECELPKTFDEWVLLVREAGCTVVGLVE